MQRIRRWLSNYSLIILVAAIMGYLAWRDYNPSKANTRAEPGTLPIGTHQSCQLTHVTDGDSLRADCDGSSISVRIHAIDAPEMGQSPWGNRAKQALIALLESQNALLTLEVKDVDRYQRTVAVVWLEQPKQPAQDIGLAMLRQGQAVVYEQYNDNPDYLIAQRAAKAANVGIWSTAGAQQTPAKWRKYHPNTAQ